MRLLDYKRGKAILTYITLILYLKTVNGRFSKKKFKTSLSGKSILQNNFCRKVTMVKDIVKQYYLFSCNSWFRNWEAMYIYKYVNKPFYKYWSGDTATRTSQYKNFLVNLLKEKGVERVLDAACGTGVDSIMLIEQVLIRGEFRESLGMNFFSPFQPEREFKVYKSCKCSQIICSRVH